MKRTNTDILKGLVAAGMKMRYGDNPKKEVTLRILWELKHIIDAGFVDYYVMAFWIFRQYATSVEINVWGRGTMPSSIVCYCLGLTEIDPIKCGLQPDCFVNDEQPKFQFDIEVSRFDEFMKGAEELLAANANEYDIPAIRQCLFKYIKPYERLSKKRENLDKVQGDVVRHAHIVPSIDIPQEFGNSEDKCDEYLKYLSFSRAKQIYGKELPEEVSDRLNDELQVIKQSGAADYFLFLQDIVNTAQSKLGGCVGPGRSSAAGSLVNYWLGITKIDPLKHNLLFERFMSPNGTTFPDIDLDFEVEEIVAIYRKRWEIELLFKQLKQNFPLRYFYGESANAIKIQIWVTLIANLLLMVMQRRIRRSWSFSNLATMFRIMLMYYVNCYTFFEQPENDWLRILETAGRPPDEPSLFD